MRFEHMVAVAKVERAPPSKIAKAGGKRGILEQAS
jgi:hypothetical protein